MINTTGILGLLPSMGRPAAVAALLATGLLVSACGQKGPLFLPPATPQGVPSKAVQPDPSKPADKAAAQPTS